ncbi:MAG: hypothetical protein JWQ73_3839 [Variovorax sp.]|nr:hypothetical protein [Variovorax sp.]
MRLSSTKPGLLALLLVACLAAVSAIDSHARVARIAIDKVEAAADGPYERITGHAYGELDPGEPLNAGITDIQFAPRNAQGKVEYTARFTLTKPLDMSSASGLLWYDLVNRGAPVTPGNGASRPEQLGHVALISGWQADLGETDKNWVVRAPIAKNPDGSAIVGPALARIANLKGTHTSRLTMLANAIPYDAASLDTGKARLIMKSAEARSGVLGPVREVATSDWAFADCSKAPFPGTPNPRMLCLKDAFDAAYLYELVYDVKDPIVLGTGLAAMRDVASFFRYESADSQGTPNPVAGKIRRAVAQGISQSGNALKTFLLQGFNEDESHRVVFDGANPHIAGRLTSVNLRFGLPSGSGTLYEPGGEGTLWWTRYADAARGRAPSSLLDRCTATRTCPKIFETFGASEFNARLMTVALTGTDSRADLPLPRNVRRYYFPGQTHGGDIDGGFDAAPVASPGCTMAKNPNTETEQMNALQVALSDWVLQGKEPPPSVYPTLRHRDLVANTAEAMGYPAIPNSPLPTGMAIGLFDYDFGTALNYADFAGVVSTQPPTIRSILPALMPRVNPDGNETSGLPSVLHQAPLGTYTGWNTTSGGFFKGQPCGGGLTGGYVPFTNTQAERTAAGDPRPSLEERYGTQRGYLCVVRKAIARERLHGMLLPADAERLRLQAVGSTVLPLAADNDIQRKTAARACAV